MGCLSSSQGSQPAVTIKDKQRSLSSLPHKSSVINEQKEASWMHQESSHEEIRGVPQTDNKADVFVLKTEEPEEDKYSSRHSLILHDEVRRDESFAKNAVETENTVIRPSSNISKPDQKEADQKFSVSNDLDFTHDKIHTTQKTTVVRQSENDIIVGGNSKELHSNQSEVHKNQKLSDDADSGFENPEIASVSAYSPDDLSDDEMF